MNENFDIGISYQNDIPHEIIDQFDKTVSKSGLKTEIRSREIGIYAAFEWALPTLIMAYLAKPFFDAFLKEAGKDTYAALKSGLLVLFDRIFGSKPDKNEQHRSLLFSIQFQDQHGRSIKCLFPEGASRNTYSEMLDELYHLLLEDKVSSKVSTLANMIEKVGDFGGSYFIEYSLDQGMWVAIDTHKEIEERRSKQ